MILSEHLVCYDIIVYNYFCIWCCLIGIVTIANNWEFIAMILNSVEISDIIWHNIDFYMKSLEPWAVFRSIIVGQRLFMYKSSKHLISSHFKKYIWLTLLNIIKLEINERSFFDCQNISQKRTKYKHKIYKVKQSSLQ